MTAEQNAAGAASRAEAGRHSINRRSAYRIVCRLRARIVKAIPAGRWGQARALQYLLTHSFSGRAPAGRRVTANPGKAAPGVDQEIRDTPEKEATAWPAPRPRGYQPRPLRRADIPESNGRMRPLGIPTLRDRARQALSWPALDPRAETTADPNSSGSRKGRSTADAIGPCPPVLSHRSGAQGILEGDIKSCFDRISHQGLPAHVPRNRVILRRWLKAGFREEHVLDASEEGTPRGGICSPAPANMTWDGRERKLRERDPKATARSGKAEVNPVRDADDFIITGSAKELLETAGEPLAESFLSERGLEPSAEKAPIAQIEDGFDFLGPNGRDSRGPILVKPSRKDVTAPRTEVRGILKASRRVTAGHLIVRLNPVIRGWANDHRPASSQRTFTQGDDAISRAWWQRAKRRHPQKPGRGVKDKDFGPLGGRHRVFPGTVVGRGGVIEPVPLFAASRLSIPRPIKIKGEANPSDPTGEPDFAGRPGVKMAGTRVGRRARRRPRKEQEGICPVGHQTITPVTGWPDHPIPWRTPGGPDTMEDPGLVHPTGHQQIQSPG